MDLLNQPLDQVLTGDCLEILPTLPAESVDLVVADPPYNLQLNKTLFRPDLSRVDGVDDAWDQFGDYHEYDQFTRTWLEGCRRVLKPRGTLWVIGSYHNIYRVGSILQDLGFWILNDIVWIKSNPMPNFRGVRFTNAHETLIWAQKERGARYTFNHHSMKTLNDDLQMRSDWYLPLCTGRERLKINGTKVHPTQKPEALIYRILLACTAPGEVVLDPFMGSGTTGVTAKQLCRNWIGIERDPEMAEIARQRIAAVEPAIDPLVYKQFNPRREPRVPFGALLENGLLHPGDQLFFGISGQRSAIIHADGSLDCDGQPGSIHSLGRMLQAGPCNGWQAWYYWDERTQQRLPIDHLRQKLRSLLNRTDERKI